MFDFDNDSNKENENDWKIAGILAEHFEYILSVKNEEELRDLLYNLYITAEEFTIKTMLENEIEERRLLLDMIDYEPNEIAKFDTNNIEFGFDKNPRLYKKEIPKENNINFKTNDSKKDIEDFFGLLK